MRLLYKMGFSLFGAIGEHFLDYRVYGAENIPKEGGALIASNHVSFVDPPTVGLAFKHREIYFVARKTLFKHPIFDWLFKQWNAIPIDRERPDLSTLKEIIRLARSGEQIVLFPEGTRSADGEVKRAQPGVGFLIEKSHVPVVPARIFGGLDVMPRSCTLPRPGSLAVVFGPPLDFSTPESREGLSAGKDLYQALGDRVMDAVRAIEDPR